MSITVLQALLITLFCIISNLMFPLLGDIGGYFGLGRPLIAGTITGLILGDVKTGMMIGASLNAVYMSSQAVGNVMSTDVTMAGYIATALSMAGSNDPAMALALSIPIGLFGSMLFTMQNAVCCGCAVMLYPHPSHTMHYDWGNVFWVRTQADMEDVFRRKQEAKSALAKAQTTRDKRSRKPVLDMSLPWAGKF